MSKKNILKTVVAIGVLGVLLIFLGVNFVPRIFASPSDAAISLNSPLGYRSNYTNENFPRSILPQDKYAGSDWIERHPVIDGHGFLAPLLSKDSPSIAMNGFRTPPMSNYSQFISKNGFRTPPMSEYIRPIRGKK